MQSFRESSTGIESGQILILHITHLSQCLLKVAPGFPIIRLDSKRFRKVRDGPPVVPLMGENHGKIMMGAGMVRIKPDGLAKLSDGLIMPALPDQSNTETVVKCRHFRTESDCLSKLEGSLVDTAGLYKGVSKVEANQPVVPLDLYGLQIQGDGLRISFLESVGHTKIVVRRPVPGIYRYSLTIVGCCFFKLPRISEGIS
jgi:hypothetical protein